MTIEQKLEADLKKAMLAGDKQTAETLRTVKSVLQNKAIELGTQSSGLSDEETQKVLSAEVKKRVEAADLYQKAGEQGRAELELAEKKAIETYLPEALSEAELEQLIDKHIANMGASSMADMGKVIGAVKGEAGAAADGSLVAKLVKEKLR